MSKARRAMFAIGDVAFLVAVSVVAILTMHASHMLVTGFLLAMALGMLAAMVIQFLLASAVAPLLGSIESMVPSMVVAMVSPMAVCTLHIMGAEPDMMICLWLGVAIGFLGSILFMLYAVRCKRTVCERHSI